MMSTANLSSRAERAARIVEIAGLDLPPSIRYLAVSLHGKPEHVRTLQTIPCSMFCAFGPPGPIPLSTATYVRHGVSAAQRRLPRANACGDWRGLPANTHRTLATGVSNSFVCASIWFGDGWTNDTVYGLGRGKIITMKGTACGLPEVAATGSNKSTLIAMGYDGVDIPLAKSFQHGQRFCQFRF